MKKHIILSLLALCLASPLMAAQPSAAPAPSKSPRAEVIWTRPVSPNPERYVGWPSVARLRNGDVMAVFSGDRDGHICPWGKVQMVRSSDDGETWTQPVTLANGPIDDRDAGVVQLPDGKIVVTYFTSLAYRDILRGKTFPRTDPRYWWQRHDEKIPSETRTASLGFYRLESSDNGKTWSRPEKMKVSHAPHGPAVLNDGSLLMLGRSFSSSQLGAGESGRTIISAWRSADAGRTWTCLCPELADVDGENSRPHMFHEPHAAQLPDGTIVGLLRYHGADGCMRQTVSRDGGRTWTPMTKTPMLGLPPHLLVLPDGKLVNVYGRRLLKPSGYGEYACISDDGGRTWDVANEICLSTSGDPDLGYPASCLLGDGAILTVYYQRPRPGARQALMATKWRIRH